MAREDDLLSIIQRKYHELGIIPALDRKHRCSDRACHLSSMSLNFFCSDLMYYFGGAEAGVGTWRKILAMTMTSNTDLLPLPPFLSLVCCSNPFNVHQLLPNDMNDRSKI